MTTDLMSSTDDSLYEILGEAVSEEAFGSKPLSLSEIREIGRRWFQEKILSNRSRICGNPLISAIKKLGDSDKPLTLGLIIQIIIDMAVFHRPVHEVTRELGAAAALILRLGIEKLCADP